jgi:preprotein translocase subunit SecA
MECGGLHIIGSERHESRRIDRQLRGRAGRQGDPGASQFFLSLEDDLMRLFGSDRIARLMDRLGAQEGEMLTHPLITRSIEQAQKRVELQNFQSRKRLLDYDDVMNQQREVIYNLRAFALEGGEELKGEAVKMIERAVGKRIETTLAGYDNSLDWDIELVRQDLLMHYLLTVPCFEADGTRPQTIPEAVTEGGEAGKKAFVAKLEHLAEHASQVLALVMLNVLDEKWKDHLYDLDQLRNSIGYRSWGQKDPLLEYKQEAYTMFVDLMGDIHHTFTERFLRVQLMYDEPLPPPPPEHKRRFNALGVSEIVPDDEVVDIGPGEPGDEELIKPDPMIVGAGRTRSLSAGAVGMGAPTPGAKDWSAVGRNDPCPCGSGKKFKKCHGATA